MCQSLESSKFPAILIYINSKSTKKFYIFWYSLKFLEILGKYISRFQISMGFVQQIEYHNVTKEFIFSKRISLYIQYIIKS